MKAVLIALASVLALAILVGCLWLIRAAQVEEERRAYRRSVQAALDRRRDGAGRKPQD